MHISEQFINRLILHEGLRLKPYQCPSGFSTIGVGRNLETNGISEEEARFLLKNDLNNCHIACLHFFDFYGELDAVRQEVLVEMCFNLGINKLKTFKKMLTALQLKNYALAGEEMLNSLWAVQVGKRACVLADIMKKGIAND